MGKCLTTKLNGSVDNSDLLKIGEMRINILPAPNPSKLTQGMDLIFTKPTQVSIIGDGYFTDENLSANYGKTKTITSERFFVSNGNYILSIADKYSLKLLSPLNRNVVGDNITLYKSFDITDLKYSNLLYWIDGASVTGDISAFANSTALTFIGFNNTSVTGDISAFANNTALTTLYFSDTAVTGDISAFANNTALTTLYFSDTAVTGDISAFANNTALTFIGFSDTAVTGDISAFANNTALTFINFNNTSVHGDISNLRNLQTPEIRIANVGNLTGDLAKLPAKCYYIAFGDDASKTVINWTNRDTSEYITAWSGYAKVTNVDDMLIGMAKCKAHENVATFPLWKKSISIVGTRTSASDSALATLQQKGYTVSITPA